MGKGSRKDRGRYWVWRKEGGNRRYGARREWRKEGCMRQREEKEGGIG